MAPLSDFLNGTWGPLVLVVVGLVFIYWAVSARWPENQTPEANVGSPTTPNLPQTATRQLLSEDLRERCYKVSAEIRNFYRRQKEDFDEQMRSDIRTAFSEGSHRSQWRAEATEDHEKKMVEKYSEELGGMVSALCDDLELYGWCPSEDRNRFENPTGSQDIRYTAQRLEAICGRPESSIRIQSTDAAKCKAVKDLLGKAMKEGQGLRSSHKQERNEKYHAVRDWVRRTHDLIEAAFDTAEAQYFRGSEIDTGLDPVDGCLSRLEQLMVRANSLDVNPNFDPEPYQELFVCD